MVRQMLADGNDGGLLFGGQDDRPCPVKAQMKMVLRVWLRRVSIEDEWSPLDWIPNDTNLEHVELDERFKRQSSIFAIRSIRRTEIVFKKVKPATREGRHEHPQSRRSRTAGLEFPGR